MHPLRRIIRAVLFLPIKEAEHREELVRDVEHRLGCVEKRFKAADDHLARSRADMDQLFDDVLRKARGKRD